MSTRKELRWYASLSALLLTIPCRMVLYAGYLRPEPCTTVSTVGPVFSLWVE